MPTKNLPKKKKWRKPQGPDKKERAWLPDERNWLYRRGFCDGAGCKAMRPDHTDILDYVQGYTDGNNARARAVGRHAKKVGYKPTILRLTKR